jgi:hypothetical protein
MLDNDPKRNDTPSGARTQAQSMPVNDVSCASLSAAALSCLAPVRARNGVRVVLAGERAWVFWQAGDEDVLRCVLPVQGAELFARRDQHWYRVGERLPAFHIPDPREGTALTAHLVPTAVETVRRQPATWSPASLALVSDCQARPASALRGSLAGLARWADLATTRQLAGLRGAWLGDTVVLLGERLPALAGSERFWGGVVLVPLGYRVEPALPEAAMFQVLGLSEGELALVDAMGVEVIDAAVFAPLTRAGVRRAARERSG